MKADIIGKFPISVDYSERVEEVIKRGRYDWCTPEINSEKFPPQSGNPEVVVELINFDCDSERNFSAEAVIGELDKMGYRFADMRKVSPIIRLSPGGNMQDGECRLRSDRDL